MASVTVACVFAVCAVWFVVAPPEGMTDVGWAAAGMLAVGSVVSGVATRVARTPLWVVVATPVTVMWGLAAIQEGSGLVGWWPATAAAAVGALVAAGVTPALPAAVVAQILILLSVVYPHLRAGETFESSPALMSYRLVPLLAVAALSVALAVAMGRASRRIDAAQEQALERLRHEQARTFDRTRDDEIRRVWHDTALNTLEAVGRLGNDQGWAQLRQRCTRDLRTLREIDTADSLVDGLQVAGADLGLAVTTRAEVTHSPPPSVVAAMLTAGQEALRNTAKHAAVTQVEVTARLSDDLAVVEIVDRGRGIVSDRAGMGGERAMQRGMAAVGGTAEVASQAGLGTTVVLVWQAAQARAVAVLNGLRRGLFIALVALVTVTVALWMWLTGLDSGLAQRDLRLLALALTVGVCFVVLLPVRRGAQPGRAAAIIAVAGAASITALLPLSDPLCSSVQRTSVIDPRVVVLVCIAVAFAQVGVLVTAGAVVLLTSLASAVLWSGIVGGCGPGYVASALIAVCLAGTAYLFSRALEQQRVDVDRAAYLGSLELVDLGRRRALMSGLATWSSQASRDAVRLLTEIAQGRPDSPDLREETRRCTRRLRAQLMLLGHSGPVPEVLQQVATGERIQMLIDGDPALVTPGTSEAADALRRWLPETGEVHLTVSRIGTQSSLLARSDHCAEPVTGSWADEDGHWLHLEFDHPPTTAAETQTVRGDR